VAVVLVPAHVYGRGKERLRVVGFDTPREASRWFEICGPSVSQTGEPLRLMTVVGNLHLLTAALVPQADRQGR